MPFLTKILSNVAGQVILGLVIAGLSAGWLQQCSRTRAEQDLREEEHEHYNAQMVKEQNKYGHAIASRDQAQIDLATFKKIMGPKYDSVIQAGKVKDRRLASYTAINTRLRLENLRLKTNPPDTVVRVLPGGDTVYVERRAFETGDRWFHIGGAVEEGGDVVNFDSIGFRTPIGIYGTWRREHGRLFGKKRSWMPRWGKKDYAIKVTSPNPYFVADSIVSFNLEKR